MLKPLIPSYVTVLVENKPFVTEEMRMYWAYYADFCDCPAVMFFSENHYLQVKNEVAKYQQHRRSLWQSPHPTQRSVY